MGYEWYRKGKNLLKEIEENHLPDHMVAFWYIGQMGMVIKWKKTICYIDPVLGDLTGEDGKTRRNYMPPFSGKEAVADYLFCTHDHLDHIHPQTIQDMARKNPGMKIVVPKPLVSRICQLGIERERIIGIRQGENMELAERVSVKGIATAHESYQCDSAGNSITLGYVLSFNGIRLFHSGDTVVTESLIKEILGEDVDVLMIPINGVDLERHQRNIIGNMNSRDAAYFGKAVNADLIIPMHYDMVKGNEENPLLFADYMERYYQEKKYHLMRLGEKLIYE